VELFLLSPVSLHSVVLGYSESLIFNSVLSKWRPFKFMSFSCSPKHDTCPDKRILLDVMTRIRGDEMEYFRLTTGHGSLAARLFIHPNVCFVPRR